MIVEIVVRHSHTCKQMKFYISFDLIPPVVLTKFLSTMNASFFVECLVVVVRFIFGR